MRYWELLQKRITTLTIPQPVYAALSNPARMSELTNLLTANYGSFPKGREESQVLLEHVKAALAVALHDVFILGAATAAVGLILMCFVTEKKLRSK